MKQLVTHCIHGHEYTPENTMWSDGRRKCRKCNAKRARRYYDMNLKKSRLLVKFKVIAAIINDPTKSYFDISCDLQCSYEWVKQIARKMGQQKRKPGRMKKTHCPQGHPYSGDNVTWSNGYPKCRTCARDHMRRFRTPQEPKCGEKDTVPHNQTTIDPVDLVAAE